MHFKLGGIFVPRRDLIASSTCKPWLHAFAALRLLHVGLEGMYTLTSHI